MVKMDSLTMSTSCAMLTVGKSNHSVAGTQFFVDLEILLGYLEKSWSDGRVMVNSTVNCGKRLSGCRWDVGWSELVMDAAEQSGKFMEKAELSCVGKSEVWWTVVCVEVDVVLWQNGWLYVVVGIWIIFNFKQCKVLDVESKLTLKNAQKTVRTYLCSFLNSTLSSAI